MSSFPVQRFDNVDLERMLLLCNVLGLCSEYCFVLFCLSVSLSLIVQRCESALSLMLGFGRVVCSIFAYPKIIILQPYIARKTASVIKFSSPRMTLAAQRP